MKSFLFFLLFIPVLSGGQAIVPGKVNYQGHAYWRLGDHKDTAYLASPASAWGWEELSNYPVPANAHCISFYKEDSTKAAMIFRLKDNLLEGKAFVYWYNGNKAWEINYHLDEQDGFIKFWTENGKQSSKGKFVNDCCRGKWRKWFDNGALNLVERYDKHGEPHGKQVEFYDNSQKKEELFFSHGQIVKNQTKWHPNGAIKSHIRIEPDTIQYCEYHSDGQISGRGNISNGYKIGHWVYYYENGNKKAEGDYGPAGLYRKRLGFDTTYLGRAGKWTFWHPNGVLMAIGEYYTDKDFYSCISSPIKEPLKWQTEQYYNDKGEVISEEVPSLEVFLDDDPSFLEEWR